MKKIKHAVVLVNYNSASDTIDCINSINESKDAPHIIVVDNGSQHGSIDELRSVFKDLDIILAGDNLGFSAGNNLGIKKALKMGADVVYLLNNDTVVDPNLFFRSYRYVSGKNRIAGGKIYYSKGREYHKTQKDLGNIIWYAGGSYDQKSGLSIHRGVDELDQAQYDTIEQVEFVTGCFMAIPAYVFKKIGLLDESFFLYLEDTDFSLHAGLSKIEVMYNPKLIIYHKNSSSTVAGSSLVDYYITRNRFFLAKRYGTFRLRFALFREAIFRNWGSAIRRQAFIDYLTGKMGNRNEKISAIMAQTKK